MPVLHLDLSSKKKEDLAIMSYQIEHLTQELAEKNKRIKYYEEQFKTINDEVKFLFILKFTRNRRCETRPYILVKL